MKVVVDRVGSVTVLGLSGKIDASNSADLKAKFSEAQHEPDNYVMNFSEVDFIDSSGLGAFVSCLKSALERGGNIKVSNLQKKVRMVFEITRIHKICDIYDNVEAAVDSYRS
jgi:anti-sigma B factor antagonist